MNIASDRIATALINSARNRAEQAEASAASLYTTSNLNEAFQAMQDGTHQPYPAAGHYLGIAQAAWAEFSNLNLAKGRINRDRRNGQLTLGGL